MRHNRIPHNLKLQIPTAAVFEPLLDPAPYKGAWGGRGSGKSWFFGDNSIEEALAHPGENGGEGLAMVCLREVQKDLKHSAKRLIETRLAKHKLGESQGFKIYNDRIQLPGDGIMIFNGMQDHNSESIKSLEGFDIGWFEEAQNMSALSLELLDPTFRKPGCELWFSWNPRRPTDAVDQFLRTEQKPDNAVVVRANWSDNPWFNQSDLPAKRERALQKDPDNYEHVWEGGYATVRKGAYYAKALNEARLEKRIGFFPRDSLYSTYAFWDIGSSSDQADCTAIWIVQFIGEEIRCLNYYEAVGQEFPAHANWLRKHHYDDTTQVLPHDGKKHDVVYKITPQSFLREAGFEVATPLENGGKGAAIMRMEETRKIFPQFTFNEETTRGGRDALGWYHERQDEVRGIGLGPMHDWSSHAADAFGNIAVFKKMRMSKRKTSKGPIKRRIKGIA